VQGAGVRARGSVQGDSKIKHRVFVTASSNIDLFSKFCYWDISAVNLLHYLVKQKCQLFNTNSQAIPPHTVQRRNSLESAGQCSLGSRSSPARSRGRAPLGGGGVWKS